MDKAIKKTELIINALTYARKHKLDIANKDDVKKLLEIFDPEHTSTEKVEQFMSNLQDAYTFMEMTARKRDSNKEKLPN
mgnify:CR=1 FL=1